jgi:hypothetical protein
VFALSIPVAFLWSPTAALLSWVLSPLIGIMLDRRRRSHERREQASPMAPPGG